ncbi:hypothetical protein [Lysobacter enzymogenes]|uniref:Serine protease n=1 Tax=Lysobacter enzymogenes TaxID=69 RepID=A0AAU9AQ09_LYSEN|nr:hypothetical protein [Lysobacter enzymogenes]BAV96792.1 conserved hypothetical protein [Lysobacter enzymogenes]
MSPLSRRLVPAAIAVSLCLAVGACMASGNASSDAAKPPAPKAAPNLPSEASVDAVPTPEPQPMPSDRAADPNKPKAQVGEPVGAGPFGQFIVKYRDDTQPLKQVGAVQPRLDRTAAQFGKRGLALTWKHRMGINADVFSVSPALDRGEAVALMNAFAADPDVQFIEPDNHISLGPIIRQPATVDK